MKEFQYCGSGEHLKNDDEMKAMNAEEADAAFKKYKKEILDVYMKEQGFDKYKTSSYVRLNKIGLIEYINLQKEQHGSRTFTVNIALFPLYAPHLFITIGFGDRIGHFVDDNDFWWDYKDMDTARKSFGNVVCALNEYVLPWFEKHNDETLYEEELRNEKYRLGYDSIIWITHIFIKNNDIAGARNYIENIKDMNFYKEATGGRKEYIDNKVKEMQEILAGLDDVKQYIADVKKKNVTEFKLPAKMMENKK
ncbi:MAG: DUF4304 domain-containing protein [Lachnospiraceae bacterium]|nr:DUF4304 domain-containing protein [Lachnospiraceae bacterium]